MGASCGKAPENPEPASAAAPAPPIRAVKPFVGGNWKCNGTKKSVEELLAILNGATVNFEVDVAICPPIIFMPYVKEHLKHPHMFPAAQNCYDKTGAFTGEIAASELADYGVHWTILGHSERRTLFGDTDATIAAKAAACYAAGVSVIGCLGETLAERQKGEQSFLEHVIYPQLKAYADVTKDWSKLVLAYEPLWAIGTGVVAKPEEAQVVHAAIRKWIATHVGESVAATVRIIYGGSVTAKNAGELFKEPDINGFLVGGASLKPEFLEIITATGAAK
eukprot:NODE_1073_length_1015_cov_603.227743_g890_i0.p2 GENE.NODE_1073_length_1015_cov_603.227743_g890_i0~~NODE_1073_length_1015_cov_603.227743_g890_i0.p2  ORF type:complete len:278 (+),score=86.89 NODE_1073_length_1015_cov_603.227743_g890_i0:79-912(+)